MLEEISLKMISFLKEEYKKSTYRKTIESFFNALNLREVPRIDLFSIPRRVVNPYIFVVALVVFLGLSDHALSFTGTVGVILGILGFVGGVELQKRKIGIPRLPEKFFYPLLLIFIGCAVGMFFDWSLFLKFALIPLVLLYLTRKHTGTFFFIVLLGSLFVLKEGFWGVALPFTFLSLIFLATQIESSFFDRNVPLLAFTFLVVGALFWVFDVVLFGGFPLLQPEARGTLDATFTMLSHLLPVGCVMTVVVTRNRTASLLLVLGSLVLMALLGYRTQVVLVMLASCFAAFLTDVITGTETVAVVTGTGILGLLLTSLRNVILQTRITLFEAVRVRVSVTLDIYDMMANLGGILGYTKGQVYVAALPSLARLMPVYAYSPRRYIAEFVGMDVSATSTVLGPLAVDFGLVGITAGMAFLGFLLGKLYERKSALGVSLYCVVLSYALIGIETGIVDFEVLLLFFLSLLYVLTRNK